MDEHRGNSYIIVEVIQEFHKKVECVLKGLVSTSLPGFSALFSDSYRCSAQSMIVSCTADTPEVEDMISAKRGNMKNMPCYRYQASKPEFAPVKSWREWGLFSISQMLSSAGAEYSANEKVFEHMLPHIKPVLDSFHLMSIYRCEDIYIVFRIERIHSPSLGISKLLEEFIFQS